MIPQRKYFRIMLGSKSIYADECFKNNFIGCDWLKDIDLSGKLSDNWHDFNHRFIPVYLEENPQKSKVAAGLACGMLHTICKGIGIGDIVFCPNGKGAYFVGEITSEYYFVPGEILPHRRMVKWYPNLIDRSEMSQPMQRSTGSVGTVSDITKYSEEIEDLIAGKIPPSLIANDTSVEDPLVFAMEKHLEDFLAHNWAFTELGKKYDIFIEDGEIVGQQYPTDTGQIDILAISKDKKELLVVELKKGRASDVVVGQIQRYMGYVLDDLAEQGQTVRGAIIALEDDIRLRRALRAANNIEFYRYQVNFKLITEADT